MVDLLKEYGLQDMLIFIVLFAIAIKSIWELIDFYKKKNKNGYDTQREKDKLTEMLEKHEQAIEKIMGEREEVFKKLDMLIDSDRDDIRAWIVEKHHYHCFEKGYIDDYTLDCMEKRFARYEEEGGNSYVLMLMNEVRKLPRYNNIANSIDKEKNK